MNKRINEIKFKGKPVYMRTRTIPIKPWSLRELGLVGYQGDIMKGPVWDLVARGKGAGPDAIADELLDNQQFRESLTDVISDIFNNGQEVPQDWMDSRIMFLIKDKTKPRDSSNVRPIVISSLFSKVLEATILFLIEDLG